MDVRKLEAFCKVYELQNFSKAGEVMYLSQPTISSHVANLEDELGVRLFDRMGRKVMATQAGHVLYRSALRVFRHLEEARASIEVLRDKVVGELYVGASTIPSMHIVPGLIAKFSSQYPDVDFTVHTGDSSEVIKRVADGDWPVGIVGYKPDVDGLHAELLMEDESAVVVGDSASFMGSKDDLTLEDVLELPWIMREKGSATRTELEKVLSGIGKTMQDINVHCLVNGSCETIAHILAGGGVSILSKLATRDFIKAGVMHRINVPELDGTRKFYLIYHADRHMFPALRTFVDFALSR